MCSVKQPGKRLYVWIIMGRQSVVGKIEYIVFINQNNFVRLDSIVTINLLYTLI